MQYVKMQSYQHMTHITTPYMKSASNFNSIYCLILHSTNVNDGHVTHTHVESVTNTVYVSFVSFRRRIVLRTVAAAVVLCIQQKNNIRTNLWEKSDQKSTNTIQHKNGTCCVLPTIGIFSLS